MVTLKALMLDGTLHTFEHITKIEYNNSSCVSVSGDSLITHRFPLQKELHLFSDAGCVTFNGKDVRYLKVMQES
jgi:hypothetical protein